MSEAEYGSAMGKEAAAMEVARAWARERSKDPSTKVGAAVYNPRTGAMHLGYNGFPPGFPDLRRLWDNRDPELGVTKHELVVHAEANAVRKAWQAGEDTSECVLVCTHVPCPACMRDFVAPAGIRRVVYESDEYVSNTERQKMVRDMIARELGIEMVREKKG